MKKLVVFGLLLAAVASLVPAHASPYLAFRFNGTVSLPVFPCFSGCVGTLTGTATGQLENTGVNGSGPINATFAYTGSCYGGGGHGSGTINGVAWAFSWSYSAASHFWFESYYTYGAHWFTGEGVFTSTPLVPSGCLPGGALGSVTWKVTGAAYDFL